MRIEGRDGFVRVGSNVEVEQGFDASSFLMRHERWAIRRNVAIFASAFHPSLGGVEALCRQLALEYQRRGIGVIVLTNRWPRDLLAFTARLLVRRRWLHARPDLCLPRKLGSDLAAQPVFCAERSP
jgi:hypothetical protein